MELESWLDGYDTRKNDLLAWFGEGGDAVAGVKDLVTRLEETLKGIRQQIQADAATADLARLDELLGGAEMVGDAGPERTIVESAPTPAAEASFASAAQTPPLEAAADLLANASPVQPPQSLPTATAPPAPPPPAEEMPEPTAAEGILKSLAWMDSRLPDAPAPQSRSRTASRPAVLDMFNMGAAADHAPEPVAAAVREPTPVAAPAEPVAAPAPDARAALAEALVPEPAVPEPAVQEPVVPEPPVYEPVAAPEPAAVPQPTAEPSALAIDDALSFLEPSPAPTTVFDTPPAPPTPAPEAAALSVFDAPGPVVPSAPEPPPVVESPPPAAAVAPPPPPAPAAPVRKRKPIVIDCPDGEQRRAALADVGAGPDVPYVLHAVIEIPRGGGTGYVYNDMKDVFVVVDHPTAESCAALSHVAYGCVPDTVSDDGAHLDAFVLSSGAAGPGELMRVRPLGYLRRADGDHKLICVPEKHAAEALAQIPETILRDCESWKNPTGVTGGTWCDGQKARELIRRCIA